MPEFLQRALAWIVLLWQPHARLQPSPEPEPTPQPPEPEPTPEPSERPLPEPPTQAAPLKPRKPKPVDVYGQFYFREQILDQLDDYFAVARRMRKFDPHTYALYSHIGAHVMPYKDRFFGEIGDDRTPQRELPAWWKANRPAFGAICLVHPEMHAVEASRKDIFYPRFVWFTKFQPGKAPIHVQPVKGGDVYTVGMYWQHRKDKQDRFADVPQEFPILIDENNNVHVLNVHMRGMRTVPSRCRGRGRKGGDFRVPDVRWGIPKDFLDWAAFHKLEVHDHLRHLFIGACMTYEIAQYSMVRIDVKKHSMHAVFGVDVRRTPYFFRDREHTVNVNGTTRRIFHIVRAHTNRGRFVRTHFRGEREFEWNGYHVRVTVPGRDHILLPEFNVGSIDADKCEHDPRSMISQGHLGHMLQQHVEGEPLQEALRRKP